MTQIMYGLKSNRHPSERIDSYYHTYEEADDARRDRVLHTREFGDLIGSQWLDIVCVERESRPCTICGEEIQADSADVDYCRMCHYTGRAHERGRKDQLDSFREVFPDAWVGVEHTGGGCFWLAFRWDDDPKFYVATNGEASLPEVKVDDEWKEIVTGGWGYIGRHDDTEPTEGEWDAARDDPAAFYENFPDFYGTALRSAGPTSPETKYDAEAPEWISYNKAVDAYWQDYPANTLADDEIIAAIQIDRAARNRFSGS